MNRFLLAKQFFVTVFFCLHPIDCYRLVLFDEKHHIEIITFPQYFGHFSDNSVSQSSKVRDTYIRPTNMEYEVGYQPEYQAALLESGPTGPALRLIPGLIRLSAPIEVGPIYVVVF